MFKSPALSQDTELGPIDEIHFDDARPTASRRRAPTTTSNSKKRKRDAEEPDVNLPTQWNRELHGSGGSAVVVFREQKGAQAAWKAAQRAARKQLELVWGDGVKALPELGSKRYQTHINSSHPTSSHLQSLVDSYMTSFAAYEASKAKALARQRSVPDADGFVTVTRGARTGPARLDDAKEKLVEQEKKERKKRESMGDFYRFQTREKRKQRERELIEQFEGDRKRVQDMVRQKGVVRPL